MKFRIVLEFDPEASSYSAICPELPGCASAGDTEEEARANIEEAIRLFSQSEAGRNAKETQLALVSARIPRHSSIFPAPKYPRHEKR